MKSIIIGIDPDSSKHGVAIYEDGVLVRLENWQLLDLYIYLNHVDRINNTEIHIENVCGNNATFSKSFVKNKRAESAVSRSLGKCQQSQIELERVFERLGIKVIRHKISKQWKASETGKRILKDRLGWSKSSNEDTRSAAYFGYLGVKQ
jgi:hypothetical protein